MKVNELRVGNDIYFHPVNQKRQIAVVDEAVIFDYELNAAYYRPIPLTEQWLKDFGFEENDTKDFYYINCGEYRMKVALNGFSGTLNKNPNWWVSINMGHGSQPVTIIKEYVHQFQNLYFALTGKELTK